MSQEKAIARQLFQEGCNCAQASFAAFADRLGLPKETAIKIASAFGGGIVGSGNICGAITGALMAAGYAKGYLPEDGPDAKKKFMGEMKEILNQFEEKHGSLMCTPLSEKVALPEGAPEPEVKPCTVYVEDMVELVAAYLDK